MTASRLAGAALLALMGIGPGAASPAPPDPAAGAQRLLASIENRPCPAFGDRTYINGLNGADQLATAADREIGNARQAMQTLERLVNDPDVSEKARANLVGLGSWTVAQSLANWTLLRLGQQAQVDPAIVPGQPFPTDIATGAQNTLAQFAAARALTPDAAMLVGRLRDATGKCAMAAREAVMATNDAAIRSAIAGARSPDDLRRINETFQIRQAGGRTPVLAAWEDRLRAVTPRSTRAPAVAATTSSGPTQAELAVVRRFVAAANRQDKSGALAELTDDVQLITPNGRYSGKAEVSQAVAQQSSKGSSGGLSAPTISGGNIVSSGRASGFNVVTYFELRGGKISRMTIRLA